MAVSFIAAYLDGWGTYLYVSKDGGTPTYVGVAEFTASTASGEPTVTEDGKFLICGQGTGGLRAYPINYNEGTGTYSLGATAFTLTFAGGIWQITPNGRRILASVGSELIIWEFDNTLGFVEKMRTALPATLRITSVKGSNDFFIGMSTAVSAVMYKISIAGGVQAVSGGGALAGIDAANGRKFGAAVSSTGRVRVAWIYRVTTSTTVFYVELDSTALSVVKAEADVGITHIGPIRRFHLEEGGIRAHIGTRNSEADTAGNYRTCEWPAGDGQNMAVSVGGSNTFNGFAAEPGGTRVFIAYNGSPYAVYGERGGGMFRLNGSLNVSGFYGTWVLTSDPTPQPVDAILAASLPAMTSAIAVETPIIKLNYAVQAGGGSGGEGRADAQYAGGGGAGGLLNGSVDIDPGATLEIIVGLGGPKTANNSNLPGSNGTGSAIFGLVGTTGGGGGGAYNSAGLSGGSGGGAGGASSPGAGSPPQGTDGGFSAAGNGGGGGGAGTAASTITPGLPRTIAMGPWGDVKLGCGGGYAAPAADASVPGSGGRARYGSAASVAGMDGIVYIWYQGAPKYLAVNGTTVELSGWTRHTFTVNGRLISLTNTEARLATTLPAMGAAFVAKQPIPGTFALLLQAMRSSVTAYQTIHTSVEAILPGMVSDVRAALLPVEQLPGAEVHVKNTLAWVTSEAPKAEISFYQFGYFDGATLPPLQAAFQAELEQLLELTATLPAMRSNGLIRFPIESDFTTELAPLTGAFEGTADNARDLLAEMTLPSLASYFSVYMPIEIAAPMRLPAFVSNIVTYQDIHGTVDADLPGLRSDIFSRQPKVATLGGTLPSMAMRLSGQVQYLVNMPGMLANLLSEIEVFADNYREGELIAGLPAMTADITVWQDINVTAASVMPSLTMSAAATVPFAIVSLGDLPRMTAEISGRVANSARMNAVLPSIAFAGSVSVPITVEGLGELGALVAEFNGTADNAREGALTSTLPTLGLNVSAWMPVRNSFAGRLPAMLMEIEGISPKHADLQAVMAALESEGYGIVDFAIVDLGRLPNLAMELWVGPPAQIDMNARLPVMGMDVRAGWPTEVSLETTLPAMTAALLGAQPYTVELDGFLMAMRTNIVLEGLAADTGLNPVGFDFLDGTEGGMSSFSIASNMSFGFGDKFP